MDQQSKVAEEKPVDTVVEKVQETEPSYVEQKLEEHVPEQGWYLS